jgi:hypothetical protein
MYGGCSTPGLAIAHRVHLQLWAGWLGSQEVGALRPASSFHRPAGPFHSYQVPGYLVLSTWTATSGDGFSEGTAVGCSDC